MITRRCLLATLPPALGSWGCAKPPPGLWLDVAHIPQETLLCVPTAAAMVLAYYGDPQPPRKLKSLAAGRTYAPGGEFTDFSITLYRDLIRGLSTLGYDWAERTLPLTPEGFETGVGLIDAALRLDRPIIVDATVPSGHTFVINGLDRPSRIIRIVDPALPPPGRANLSFEQFEAVWNERAYGGDFRAIMLTQPKAA